MEARDNISAEEARKLQNPEELETSRIAVLHVQDLRDCDEQAAENLP